MVLLKSRWSHRRKMKGLKPMGMHQSTEVMLIGIISITWKGILTTIKSLPNTGGEGRTAGLATGITEKQISHRLKYTDPRLRKWFAKHESHPYTNKGSKGRTCIDHRVDWRSGPHLLSQRKTWDTIGAEVKVYHVIDNPMTPKISWRSFMINMKQVLIRTKIN